MLSPGSDARDALFAANLLGACQLTGGSVCSGCLSDAYVMADTRAGESTAQEARHWCALTEERYVKGVAFSVVADGGQLYAHATAAQYWDPGDAAGADEAAFIAANLNSQSLQSFSLVR